MLSTSDSPNVFSVSELNQRAKNVLESHFDEIRVEGEIGDFTAASSGHWYFTLKDSDAQVRCAMFRGANGRVKVRPQKGDSVRVRGRISLYTNRGEYQLICQHLQPAGDGALQLAFERLKEKLQQEGLFSQDRKRPVSAEAMRVGVVTSATGAAIHDVLSVLARRSPMTEVFLFPVPVQGTEAPAAIQSAILQANDLHIRGDLPLDVLIVGRGGGSLEDLWAFNDEAVARAVAASTIPVVSAVGHETDFSICDFTADQRAATPSAAAELVSIDQAEWAQRFDRVAMMLQSTIERRLRAHTERLAQLRARLRHPGTVLARQQQDLIGTRKQLARLIKQNITQERRQLDYWQARLAARHPRTGLRLTAETLKLSKRQLRTVMNRRLQSSREQLAQQRRLLASLSPTNTLARGYAIVTTTGDQIVRSASEVSSTQPINVRLGEGELAATVTKISPAKDS